MHDRKIAGIETEYGVHIRGMARSDPFIASQLLLHGYQRSGGLAVSCQSSYEIPLIAKRRQGIGVGSIGIGLQRHVQTFDHFSFMLENGARFYIDHAHPEYSTPESGSARTLLAADKAGEAILSRCCQWVNQCGALPAGQAVVLYKNNSDHKGNSYGCHENYLLSTRLYEDLLYHNRQYMLQTLLPFLVTRTILCGSGKVGSEYGRPSAGFQLSQRADFFDRVMALDTTIHRPLFNTRDEPHDDPGLYRRLHVIIGDANMAEYSCLLKIGTMQLVLRMMEDGYIRPQFQLAKPLEAMYTVSRDLSFKVPLALKTGEMMTALEIQKRYLALAKSYLEQYTHSSEEQEVVHIWQETLETIESEPQRLSKRLDWAIKKKLLDYYLMERQTTWRDVTQWQGVIEQTLDLPAGPEAQTLLETHDLPRATLLRKYMDEHHLSWEHYQQQRATYFGLRRIDLEYHSLEQDASGQPTGFYQKLVQSRGVDRLLTDEEVNVRITQPPSDTRAWLRGQWIKRFAPFLLNADWGSLHFQIGELHYAFVLVNPLEGNEASWHERWQQLKDVDALRHYLLAQDMGDAE